LIGRWLARQAISNLVSKLPGDLISPHILAVSLLVTSSARQAVLSSHCHVSLILVERIHWRLTCHIYMA